MKPDFLARFKTALGLIFAGLPETSSKPRRVLVALSGGADSLALLHGLLQSGQVSPQQLLVIHVDHGLQAPSAGWAQWCQDLCATLGLEFRLLRLQLEPAKGESLEAEARQARYQAILALMQEGDLLLTGHHADDQAETLLLQLLRGSGLGGLAAMPKSRPFGPGLLARPLLGTSRRQIEDWLRGQAIDWLNDPTNQLTHHDRNYLRHEVMPLLERRWPATLKSLGRSAHHCAEADALLNELAQERLANLCPAPDQLEVKPLLGLSGARRRWLLRAWLRQNHCPMPNEARLEVMATELLEAGQDRQPQVTWAGLEVRRFQGRLHLLRSLAPLDSAQRIPWPGPTSLELPHNGRLVLQWRTQGLPESLWRQGKVWVGYRQNGGYCTGRFRPLKKLLQASGIPPWLRGRVPLVFAGEQLVAVAGLGLCLKAPHEAGWWPVWDRP